MFFRKSKKEDVTNRDDFCEITPIILEDSHGIKFVLREYERPYRKSLVRRACDDDVFAAYASLLKEGDVVFDVGAHIGRYSVFPSRLIGRKGQVYSFEPVEENYWQLKTTLALNRCENVTAINKAVSDRKCEVEINLFDKEFSSWSSLGKPEMTTPDGRKVKPHRTETVQSETIDSFCAESDVGRINFLKIDVEGFELKVLNGAKRMLKAHLIDNICFEVSAVPLDASGVSTNQIVALLHSCGYEVFKILGPPYRFDGPITDLACFHGNFYASFRDLSSVDNKDL